MNKHKALYHRNCNFFPSRWTTEDWRYGKTGLLHALFKQQNFNTHCTNNLPGDILSATI